MNYDVIIVGAGAGGIFAAYELIKSNKNMKVLVLESGSELSKRKCPIDNVKVKKCINCKTCSIMQGFGGAGAFSDGKYNITNSFGGDLYNYVGKKEAIELMKYVDTINMKYGGRGTKLYTTTDAPIKLEALKYDLHLLDSDVRHLGTDKNYKILENIYNELRDSVDFLFNTNAKNIEKTDLNYIITTDSEVYETEKLILATGRSGSKWTSNICEKLGINTKSNRVDIGVRVEVPALVWKHITDDVYESKLVYKTKKYGDMVRTFCMNPYGEVVTENTNGIITVNGHSYDDPSLRTDNTNFALLVTSRFTEPFKDSNEYGESIAKLSNMLGGGVIVQQFGDLINGRRSNESRMRKSFLTPTLNATPGDLSLVLPKRQLEDIIEMIYALDNIAKGTANESTLLYGVEVKFYNSEVEVDKNLQTILDGLYVIGDSSGVTHSLSQAAASGVHVARVICEGK